MAASNRGRPETEGDLSPGEHLRREIERLDLDQVAVSKATRVSRQTINNIVNDRQPISRAMSAKLARLMGHSSDYWLRKSYPRQAGNRDQAASSFARKNGVLVNHQIVRAVKDGVLGIEPFTAANVRIGGNRSHARRRGAHQRRGNRQCRRPEGLFPQAGPRRTSEDKGADRFSE